MKRRFTILTAALALLAFLAIPMGVWGQTRSEEVYSTCLFGSDYNNQSVGSYTATWTATNGDYTWTIVNGNNNNNAWSYVKFGRKNNASVGEITTTEAYEQAITKVDLTIDAITAVNVNSIKLYASTDNDTWTEVGSFAKSSGLQTVTVASPAADQYYKIEFDCASGSANGLVTVSKVEYYYNTSGTSSPTISADNVELAYDATSGAIEYTVNNPVQGGELSATTNAEWITIGTVGETVPFTCTVNEGSIRTATVTLTYSYGNDNVTKDITVTQAANPNGPGSQANPYTVAQARAAIDANSGTQGVYATGIVSAIPTAYNSTYGNVTFNMVDEAGDEVFLQAYRCGGDEAANVAVGDVAVVYGNLTKYGSTYEFGQGCTLVSLTHPVITTPVVTVTPNTINAPAEGADGTLALTYENIEEFISFDYYFCDADGNELEDTDPDYPGDWIYAEINDENDAYTLDYIIDANQGEARTAYIKVYTFDDNEEEVYAIVTVNQEAYVAPTYAELPFAFNDGKAAIEGTDGLSQEGLGSDYSTDNTKLKFDGTGDWLLLQFDERPGTLTFNIKGNSFSGSTFTVQTSEDGETFTNLKNYTDDNFGNTVYSEEFTDLGENVRYIKWIYTEKVQGGGNVGLGNIALAEYVAPVLVASITVNPDEVELDAEEHDGTLALAYENLTITDMTDFDIQFCDANGDELSEEPDWIEVLVAEQDPTVGEGYVVSYYMVENEGPDARTAYFKVYAMDDETNLVYSNLVTISQAAPVAPATGDAYALYTGELVEGDYLIVYDGGAMNTTVTSDRLQYEDVTVNNDVITTDNAAIVWHIASSGQYWTIYNADAEAYAASTGAKNKAQMLADGTDDKALWTVSVSGTETYEFVNKKNAANNVNANLRKNGEYGFACYATSTGGALSLYKKVALPINGYGDDSNPGGYYLIASPLGTINPANVPGMLSDTYDLYYFDQNTDGNGNEWINYKGGSFNLEPGTGYLYAHNSTITLNFTGTPIEGTDYEVTLRRNGSARFKGWNLVGNPFTKTAYVDNTHNAYYTMDGDGALFVPVTGNSVDPMEGIFVVAKSDEEIITFSTTNPNEVKCSTLALNLSQGQSLLDRAIVRFDEGSQLPKLQFNRNSSKVCIPMDDEDYAVVRAEEMGEMPVNFKAESNGTYSLNFGMDNVEFAYLHLIDNLTGNEVDLLQTPSYSFEAKTTDYENRFKLVFATGDNSNEDNFAYFSNGSFVINNEGNATLQVIDITGRIVKSESVNGCANVNVNGAAGVYMLRLVNGDNVKVQKVVVK